MCSKPCANPLLDLSCYCHYSMQEKNFRRPPTKFLKNPCKFQNYEFFKGRHQCAVNPVLLLSSQHARKMTLVWQFWCDFSFQVDVRQRMNEKKNMKQNTRVYPMCQKQTQKLVKNTTAESWFYRTKSKQKWGVTPLWSCHSVLSQNCLIIESNLLTFDIILWCYDTSHKTVTNLSQFANLSNKVKIIIER